MAAAPADAAADTPKIVAGDYWKALSVDVDSILPTYDISTWQDPDTEKYIRDALGIVDNDDDMGELDSGANLRRKFLFLLPSIGVVS